MYSTMGLTNNTEFISGSINNTNNIGNNTDTISINDMSHQVDLAFSEDIYFPESLLTNWLNVSGIMLTSSLVFYHMSRVKSIKVEPYLAKIIAIGLIVISTCYMIYALIPYIKRMDYNINKCIKLKECSDEQTMELKILKWSYIILGVGTSVIQGIITFLVITTI